MSAWLTPPVLAARRAAAAGPLAPLADSLARDVGALLDRDLTPPPQKARLSRLGGRCPVDGTLLAFDPWSPRLHRCPTCGREYDDEVHYRWWIMNRQLWLAERAVHAALLYALRNDPRHGELARRILRDATDAYLQYPNQDNVLGPTRPFFSTYLESIWLLQLCTALDMLEAVEHGTDAELSHEARNRLIAPSAALIASYDEGFSNRQVWNNAALLAASILLGDGDVAMHAVWGRSGLARHLELALLPDGSWYEGENYHLFAHRGLWYGARLAEASGQGPLPPELVARFQEGFVTPFLTALPDFTMPARRDSQYGVSLRQWRFAELAELGVAAHPDDRRLHHALVTLYDGSAPDGDTGRWRSTAEAERNEPPARLTRAELGWRSLLAALPELPPLRPRAPHSLVLEAQGLAVFRRGQVYGALDYGESGGGHGHPDRLHLLLSIGGDRWLDDPGTGSYVDPSLHWYRSTLAHNAPMIEGRSQRRTSGTLLAFEERDGAGWADAEVHGVAPGVGLRRTIVVMPDYLLDVLAWSADRDVDVTLPIHHDAELRGVDGWSGADATALEGGGYLCDVECAAAPAAVVTLHRPKRDAPVACVAGSAPVTWWRALAPGPPTRAPRRVHLARLDGRAGTIASVWCWSSAMRDMSLEEGAVLVRFLDGGEHRHRRAPHGWHVDLSLPAARSSIDLGGLRRVHAPAPSRLAPRAGEPAPQLLIEPLRFRLAEWNYRRSEVSWQEAGAPTADVELSVERGELSVSVNVAKPSLAFASIGGQNDMDNERPEINGDGIQLHIVAPGIADGAGAPMLGWILVPLVPPDAHVVALDARSAGVPVRASWERTDTGYHLRVRLPVAALRRDAGEHHGQVPAAIGVAVNDGAPGRERRRGQLVPGRAAHEFVYLRGDRLEPSRCIPVLLPDG